VLERLAKAVRARRALAGGAKSSASAA